jgi:hypothetical protein
MMETEIVSKSWSFYSIAIKKITREDFITFGVCGSFSSCIHSYCGLLVYDTVVLYMWNIPHPYPMGRTEDGDSVFL